MKKSSHHQHQDDDHVGRNNEGGGKCKKRSTRHHHHHHHHRHQTNNNNKNELKHQKSVTSNDDGKDEFSDSTTTTTSTTTATTIGSSDHELLSNATATMIVSDKENVDADNAAISNVTTINRSLMQQHEQNPQRQLHKHHYHPNHHHHHHHHQYHEDRTLSRRLSEPIDDYNLKAAITHQPHHYYYHQPHYQSSPSSSSSFHQRASVDPYLLEEVTKNLGFHGSSGGNYNNMSIESLAYLSQQQHQQPASLSGIPGSMFSLNTATQNPHHQHHHYINHMDKFTNSYHLYQPPSQQQYQQRSSSSPSTIHRNYNNCCRNNMPGCNNDYTTMAIGGNSDGGYSSISSPYYNQCLNPYFCDSHHLHHVNPITTTTTTTPVNSNINNNNNNNMGQYYWDNNNDYYMSNNNNSNSSMTNHNNLYTMNHSYPNLASLLSPPPPSSQSIQNNLYQSQTNLRKIMNNGGSGKNSATNNQTAEYLVDMNPSPDSLATNKGNNSFFSMDKSISSSDDVQQQQHGKQHGDEYQHQHVNNNNNVKMEKIIQLESMVNILRNQLLNTEELFKKALISKKTMENANCDLLSIVDKLKLDLIHFESQQKILKEQNIKIENEFEQLKTRLLEKDTEISSLRLTMAKIVRATGYILSGNELALLRGKTIASDYIKNKFKENYHELTFGPFVRNSNYFYSEPSSRRESSGGGRFSPVAPPRSHRNNNQQSPPTTTTTIAEHGQQQIQRQQSSLSNHHNASSFDNNQNIVEQQSQQPTTTTTTTMLRRSTSFEDMKMDSQHMMLFDTNVINNNNNNKNDHKLNKNSFSTLPHNSKIMKQIQRQFEMENSPNHHHHPSTTIHPMSQSLIDEEQMMMIAANNNKAYSTPNSPMITPFKLQQSSLHPSPFSSSRHPNNKESSSGFGVNFAQDDEMISSGTHNNTVIAPRINLDDSKPKGLRRIFSRKRSTSSLAGISDSFSRGGLRATSGPRLGFSQEKKFQNVNIPFSNWGTTLVADWFAMIGLGMYINECKRWCKNGEHLMRATSWEVEKELGIKNSLHRKKLRLAVASMNEEEDDLLKCAGKLDYLWVARWLDDIGLPQYKESFIDARVDGRVLHYLNIEDLLHLKVTNQLHFASIRAAIRVLRENNYNGQCLKRRAAADEVGQNEWNNTEVAVWSSHRIMEWLRSIDLSEYAPNLRGSGVHGALILYENAFNADLFATLLSIPASKTLLRRHISSKFKQLIGDHLSKTKHEYELMPNYQPLIPGAKIKAYKKGHFTLRKKRADFELTDYVCPMGTVVSTPISKYSALRDSRMGNELSSSTKKEDSPVSIKSEENNNTSTATVVDRRSSLKSESKNDNQNESNQNGNNHLDDDIDERKSTKSATKEESPAKEEMTS
ncbi:uncharacterized protein LOC124492533 isoform X3 [Dermatophagoides farinae]|uniref:uncharacterized protein LOC124492533 isoform X3 n=1 Tax=Dermatophagoides farinae TaxID=6954 RepID=UPI003F6202C1